MKRIRISALLMAAVLVLGAVAGCGNKENTEKKYSVVCTVFPIYDWVKEVLGDSDAFEVTYLLEKGVDLHSYQPTVKDIGKISSCDLFIYVGGESDGWAEDAIEEAINKELKTINLMELLGESIVEEELVEGMQEPHEEEEEEEEPEYDEHVWLSLRNAKDVVLAVSESLGQIDTANAAIYEANAKAYTSKLDELDFQYEDAVKNGKTDTLIFADRFPFRYLTDDYGLKYYAAFPGCSAETEAGFETITFLAGKMDELGISNLLVTESAVERIPQTIILTSKEKAGETLVLDSMQAMNRDDIANGATYLDIMKKNLEVLRKALSI